jgi:hypothetical protein
VLVFLLPSVREKEKTDRAVVTEEEGSKIIENG